MKKPTKMKTKKASQAPMPMAAPIMAPGMATGNYKKGGMVKSKSGKGAH